jgi:hypothetical protein
MSLMGCGGALKSSSTDKMPSAIDQELLSKTVIKKGEVFSYQFKLGKLQQLRFIEEEYLGKAVFTDNTLHYTAGTSLGTDVIRFELQQLDASNKTKSTVLAWMFSIFD